MPIKSRPHYGTVTDLNGTHLYTGVGLSERIEYENTQKNAKGRYTKPTSCVHYKLLEPANYTWSGMQIMKNASQLHHIPDPSVFVAQASQHAHLGLEFQKNNSFELIPFLVDWDNTLASFVDRFKRRKNLSKKDIPSYGEAKWGLLPLVSELKSLLNSFQDIQTRMYDELAALYGKRLTRRFPFRFSGSDGFFDYEVEAVLLLHGYITGDLVFPDSPFEVLFVMLDELGFHPDIATMWEVIPLSFLADSFFPIGDIYHSYHPRGWFTPKFQFDGTFSIKGGIEMRGAGTSHVGFGGYYSVYIRGPYSEELETRPPVLPEWHLPPEDKVGELTFDLMYLLFKSNEKPSPRVGPKPRR